ncbi:MAG: hypothetical protein FWH48_02160 [Oscillospiraceae bacterium]|nr:hypothetical protein [Oscillospiraceae bacterium]
MKNKKIYIAMLSALLAVAMLVLPGCDSFSGLDDLLSGLEGVVSQLDSVAEDWGKYAEARKGLTNYKIVLEITSDSGSASEYFEARTELGYVSMNEENSITYLEYGTNKVYVLNPSDKTGTSFKIENEESYKSFGIIASSYLFAFEAFRLLGAQKTGSDQIAGRNADVYTYAMDGNECKFWIDTDYGMTLKSIVTSDGSTDYMEAKEFQIGGVVLSDVVDLGEYNLQDISDMLEGFSEAMG